jgi:uncharacterized protein (TIGR00255 family)
MTGFGSAKHENGSVKISIEIRSLNSKYLDANIRMPKYFSDKEVEVREVLSKGLVRGKVNVLIDLQLGGDRQPKANINRTLFQSYYNELKELSEDVSSSSDDLFKLALQMPDVIESSDEDDLVEEWKLTRDLLIEASSSCEEFRMKEGSALEEKFREYVEEIRSNLNSLHEFEPGRIKKIKDRITQHLEEFLNDKEVDSNRLEQELIFYIEKLDITEEKVRLKNHLDHFIDVLDMPESGGKKLGFISQEIGREINTIGSKANDADMQRLVVSMKDNLEKIKEQALNIL